MSNARRERSPAAQDETTVDDEALSEADRRFLDYLAEIALRIVLNDPKMADSMDPEGSKKP